MQAKILKEVESKICLAKKYGLVPRDIMEIEFTIDQSGQGSTIEYWPTFKRIKRFEVDIPKKHRDQFIFCVSAAFL